jgi:hypothetical protein
MNGEKTMSDYRRPTYTDGYEIRYNRDSDMFECWQNDTLLSKKDKKPAAYKALGLAIKFMVATGAKEVVPEKKPLLWTPPQAATIAPLEEQLAVLPADAPRFVMVEAPYGPYKVQGYGVYDRQKSEFVCPATYNGWNFITESREAAEKEAVHQQENPPRHDPATEYDLYLFNMLIPESEKSDYPEITSGSEEEATYKRQEAAWKERLANAPKREALTEMPEKSVVFTTDRQYQVGEKIADKKNRTYTVTEKSWWLSEEDAADLEDGWDINASSGWHTPAMLVEEIQ